LEQIEGMGDLDKVQHFVEGLKPSTRQEVSYQAPETFEEAWKLAVQYDMAMFNERSRKGFNDGNRYWHNNNHNNNNTRRAGSVSMELDSAEAS
jgi:hypothetical protein